MGGGAGRFGSATGAWAALPMAYMVKVAQVRMPRLTACSGAGLNGHDRAGGISAAAPETVSRETV